VRPKRWTASLLTDRRAWLVRGAPLVALLGCALAWRLHTALRLLTEPHATSLPDDAFYDFGIARHLALGDGPTFDGFTPTNGFHPLWVALLVPIWRFAPPMDRLGPVHATMMLGAVLDVASLVVLWRLCRTRLAFSLNATIIAVGWLALNPFQVMIATCGLEAPLAQLLLLLLLDEELATRWRPAPRLRWSVLAGLALLARVDLVILVVVLLFARLRRCTPSVASLSANARNSAVALGAALALYSPWVVYSRFTTGRWIQSSAVALPFSMAELPHVWGYETVGLSTRLRMSAFALLDAVVDTLGSMGAGKGVAAAAVGGGVVALLLHHSPGIRRLAPYGIGLLLLLVVHGAVRLVFRDWYAFPFSVGYALLLGNALHCLARRVRPPWVPAALVTAVLATGIDFETHDRLRSGYFGRMAYEAHLAPFSERSGDSDGGVWCYLAGEGRMNLDGIVNWNALDALRTGAMLDYVEKQHIRSFSMAERYRHPRFMGQGWRERILVDPPWWRLATPREKDRRIALTEGGVVLGTPSGSELLSDGWLWPEGSGQLTSRSVGSRSDIVFTIDGDPVENAELELELANVELEDGSRCTRVEAELDGVAAGTIHVSPRLAWASIRPGTLGRGRHRLVLRPNRYGVAMTTSPWREGDWRSIHENALTAFDARGFTLGAVGLVALPPEGPGLAGDPTNALLGEGWLSVDRAGGIDPAVWAAGSRATLRFRANRGESRHLVVRGSAPPPANGEDGQVVTLELNGVLIGSLRYDGSDLQERDVLLADRALRQGRNDLVLHFARRGDDPLGRAFYFFSISWR
jgi:hypothetical protein